MYFVLIVMFMSLLWNTLLKFQILLHCPQCAQKHKIDYGPIHKCAGGLEGNGLEHEMAVRTAQLSPAHNYVPWVTVNGVSSWCRMQHGPIWLSGGHATSVCVFGDFKIQKRCNSSVSAVELHVLLLTDRYCVDPLIHGDTYMSFVSLSHSFS